MQSDAWAAYDTLFERHNLGASNDKQISEKKEELLLLLARFIRKLALTPQEIELAEQLFSRRHSQTDQGRDSTLRDESEIATNESIYRWLC